MKLEIKLNEIQMKFKYEIEINFCFYTKLET